MAKNWIDLFRARENSGEVPLHETLRCEVVKPSEVEKWNMADHPSDDPLRAHAIICLYQLMKAPSPKLWGRLRNYVQKGGSLIFVPGGDEVPTDELKKMNDEGRQAGLLPATLVTLLDAPGGENAKVYFKPFPSHDLTKKFLEWQRSGEYDVTRGKARPFFRRYWEAIPIDKEITSIIAYQDEKSHPALLERDAGHGRVLMFTIPLDIRRFKDSSEWNNIWTDESGFGVVLVDLACRYLAKGSDIGEVNFVCGKPVLTTLLSSGNDKQYQLKGPAGLALSETKVAVPEGRLLAVPQATQPGNYSVVGEKGESVAAFSVNADAGESRLDRVPPQEIEAALGEGTLLPAGQAPRLQDAVTGGRPGQIELLPWLMMVVLLVLGIESVLANKFYKREPNAPQSEGQSATRVTGKAEPLTTGTAVRSG